VHDDLLATGGRGLYGPPPPDQSARHPTPIMSADYPGAVVLTVN